MRKLAFRVSPWIIVAVMAIFMLFFTVLVKADDEPGNTYPSMQGGSEVYPSMQGGSEVYPSMQNYADVYPSMQGGTDISGAVYAVNPVTKTIDDATAVEVSGVPSSDLHFIQEWEITSDTYPLNVSFFIAGSENQTLYIFTDSDNGWSKMQKGPGGSMTVTFTENTHAAVYVGPGLLTEFHIDDMEIVEGTCGYLGTDHHGQIYYFYYPYNSKSFKATYVYDGVEYITNSTYNLPGMPNGYLVVYSYDMQQEEPWKAGQTYSVRATLSGKECTFNVKIVPNKLTSFQIEDISILEHTCGSPYSEPDGTSYFRYEPSQAPLVLNIVYDGKDYKGTEKEICQFLSEKTGETVSLMTMGSWEPQGPGYEWTPGQSYEVSTSIMNKECRYTVSIEEGAIPQAIHALSGTDFTWYTGCLNNYEKLAITYEPDNADIETEWISADESIVPVGAGKDYCHFGTILNGTVPGQTTVTARSKANPDLSVSFNVTVVDEEPPVGTYTTTAKFGPRLPDESYPTIDEDNSITNPNQYFIKNNSDCVLMLRFDSETCIPYGWYSFNNLTTCDVTPISGKGGYTEDGTIFAERGFLVTAKKCGTETIRFGNDYEMTLVVGDYAITFKDEDGDILQTCYVAEGDVPEYTGETPTKEDDAQYTYTFDGWTTELKAATEDASYTAKFKATPKKYAITWKNEDGTVLATDEVEYGTVPEYKGETPTKEATVQYVYTFSSWTPEVTSVTENTAYTATFEKQDRAQTFIVVPDENDESTYIYDPESYRVKLTDEFIFEIVYKGNVDAAVIEDVTNRLSLFEITGTRGWPNGDGTFTAFFRAKAINIGTEVFKVQEGYSVSLEVLDAQQMEEADYSAVEAAVAKAQELDSTMYTKASYDAVMAAVNAVEYGKTAAEQAEVDAMAQAIEDAIANLKVKTIDDMAAEKGNGWFIADDQWFYAEQGKVKKGWLSRGSTWYYMDPETGVMLTGLQTIKGQKYYLDPVNGDMKTGWIKDEGNWYYAQSSGALATGWVKPGSTWYYMDSEGVMQTGWVDVSGHRYYMASSGAMVTGWVKVGDTWYYMNSSGAMVTGWVKVGNTWYYMKSSGAMASSEWVTGYYWISASGAWTYQPVGSWKQNSTGWWFGDTSGWYAKNETIKINDVLYTFNAAGYWEE